MFTKRNLWTLLAFIIISILLTTGVMAATENGDLIPLQILTVNDFHGALLENGKNPGAARLAQFLKEIKSKDPDGTLIISAGDMFQGTPESNLLYGRTVVDVLNNSGFDATTLGNHEFDWGIDVLKQRIAQSNFSYLCANLLDKKTGKIVDFVKPYIVLERRGLNIAIIGIATPETAFKTNPRLVSGYLFDKPAKILNAFVPELKRKGIDVVVVVSHLDSWMDENGNISGDAADIGYNVNGIDAIISGHSHQTVYGKVNGVPIVQANCNGRAIGRIELVYDRMTKRLSSSYAGVMALTFDLAADSHTQSILNQTQKEIEPIKNKVIGYTKHILSHDRNELTETLLGQWVTDAMRKSVGADIAFQNSGGLRTGIPAGKITMGKLYEVMPFDNTLFTVELTGKQILEVLDYGIMNDKIGMVQYSGIKVTYDAAKPKIERIVSVTMVNGTPLGLDKTYKVVTNDFLAAGGDGFAMFMKGRNLKDSSITLRTILMNATRKQKVIDFLGDNRWNVVADKERKKGAA